MTEKKEENKKEYPQDKPSKHATIRIPKPMSEAVDEFLKTDYAKRMGYLYKVDVITAATRELLEKYGFYKQPEEETQATPVPEEKEE